MKITHTQSIIIIIIIKYDFGNITVCFSKNNLHFNESLAVSAVSDALANNVNGVDNVVQKLLVNRSQSS
jgi:hypothetical protein